MKLTLPIVAAGTLLASLPSQKDAIYYNFAAGTGVSVTNLWSAGGLAPKTGSISSTNGTGVGSWTTGKTGSALAGADGDTTYNVVATGWKAQLSPQVQPLFSGKTFSFGFFMKRRNTPSAGSSTSYFFSGVGSFRLFTGGVASSGLYLRGWGGLPVDIVLPGGGATNGFDLQTAATKAWVHVALTVDTGAGKAIWYIDGRPHLQMVASGLAAPTPSSGAFEFLVGRHLKTAEASDFDIDDFRFTTRAADPCEVSRWAMAKQQCDTPTVSLTNGGTQKLSLDFGTTQANNTYWVVGSASGYTPGFMLNKLTVPLNADFYTDITIGSRNSTFFGSTFGSLDAAGKATATLNVPKATPAILVGLTLHHACAVFDAKTLLLVDISNNVPLTLLK